MNDTARAGEDLCLLVLNCGSSSIKFALFDGHEDPPPRRPFWRGQVAGIGGPHPTYTEDGGVAEAVPLDGKETPHHAALEHIRAHTRKRLAGRRLRAVAHRVVHGGSKYSEPVLVDAAVLADLKSYIPLAPLHQPFALEAMDVLLANLPDCAQVACFDTGFHHTLPLVERMLALPYSAYERGLRRYGFHGLSYEYMSVALAERHGDRARGRTVVAHLGSGASLCGMHELRSVATTMGFSALDGLMMSTRCGALDPGAVIYLMEIEKLTLEEVGRVLYHESGLLGVSGVSGDTRELLAREREDGEAGERIRAALALYVRRIVREIGALAAVLGGLDMLVFTAGVGEHSAAIRSRVCRDLAYLGVALDEAANERDDAVIAGPGSRVLVGVEPTNEEWIAARQAMAVTARAGT
ncbi:acetate/propionate family kinase [Achromobacter aloeverae]|uniref:Acetate kinase n=1 Tax=Achromobacter aloeverae TaxID=1750518 RepID=A0A4Q1HM06_9BURK|nr:acetate/propionate family kinase [Achromobacter aloeverae]RXN91511.1 acetate kinase [Achromobacter aloeverae]